MTRSITVRIVIDLILAFSLLQGWWFVALPLGLLGMWAFPFYIEFIIAGVIYDALFGFTRSLGWVGYVGTLTGVVGTVVVLVLKKVIR